MNASRTLIRRNPTRRIVPIGFTLVELLVVIAIIGVLVALLLPAVQAAREAARRSQCMNNLKQIGLSVLNFEITQKHFPYGSTCAQPNIVSGGKWFSTWTVDILPYMEQQNIFDLWVQDKETPVSDPDKITFMDEVNRPLHQTFVDTYLCPSDVGTSQLHEPETGPGSGWEWAPGSYRAVAGYIPLDSSAGGRIFWDNPEILQSHLWNDDPPKVILDWQGAMHVAAIGRFGSGKGIRLDPVELRQITDGTSRTLLVGEYQTATGSDDNVSNDKRSLWAYAYAYYNQSSAMQESRFLIGDYQKCTTLPGSSPGQRCKRSFGSLHAAGFIQYVRCDGSVFSVSPDVDLEAFTAMATISGSNPWETKSIE